MDQTPWTQTWIAKLVAKCLRMDPRIALLVSENLETTEAQRRLRCFKSSKATNLAILIILAGDIETNPGPRSKCGLCRKNL